MTVEVEKQPLYTRPLCVSHSHAQVSGVLDMMIESIHMSISSFMELAGRLGYHLPPAFPP
jgi:hypothetical protein